jgi:hydroxymethylbilane synthase
MVSSLRIATRESPLALWQAEHIKRRLLEYHPTLKVSILGMTTSGDQWLKTSLSKIGGKGLFVKELQQAILSGNADLAVHSMKDVPMMFPSGLGLGAITEREDPSDAFVSMKYQSLSEMPSGSIIGTSSLRRKAQLLHAFPNMIIKDVRGNVNSRLAKLESESMDALILASAGLKRLELTHHIKQYIDSELMLPAVGQGALGLEIKNDDIATRSLIECLHDFDTAACVSAERAMNLQLNGGCQVPVAGFACLQDEKIWLRGRVAEVDGSRILRSESHAPIEENEQLGFRVAQELIDQGAEDILNVYRTQL